MAVIVAAPPGGMMPPDPIRIISPPPAGVVPLVSFVVSAKLARGRSRRLALRVQVGPYARMVRQELDEIRVADAIIGIV